MNGALVLSYAVYVALALLIAAMLITALRVALGPTLADRVLALDQLVAIALGFVALIAVKTGYDLYIDIAIALGLVGFLATAAFARYILMRGRERHGRAEGGE